MDRIEHLESSIAYAEARVKKADRVLALYDNPDFNEIVVKGYLEAEAIRMVGLYGSGSGSPEQLRELEKDMHGIGAFRRFLVQLVQEGRQARSDLEANKEALQEELAMAAEARASGEEPALSFDADYNGSLGA
jgi:hypothetical protein